MKTNQFIGILLILVTCVACGNSPAAIDLPLIVSNDAGAKLELHFGLHPSATDTLDKFLGEQELPPFPPTDVFEARFIGDDILLPKFGLGTYVDFRTGDDDFKGIKTHELRFQFGSGNKVIFKWDLPQNITGLIQDFFNGVVVNKNMAGNDSLVLSKPLPLDKLQMIMNYDGTPLTPILVSPKNDSSNIHLNPAMVWRSTKAANSYRLQVAPTIDFTQLTFEISDIADTAYGICDLEQYKLYYWRVMAANNNGTSDWSETWRFTTGETTPVLAFDNAAPSIFYLAQNYPNPFNPMTIIRFAIPQLTRVTLQIFDLLGREIAVLVDAELQPGEHQMECKADHLANGVYIYRLRAGQFMEQRKMLLLK